MTALSGDPVTVAAITAGLCGWLVVDEPVELGRHPLTATDAMPAFEVTLKLSDEWWVRTAVPDASTFMSRITEPESYSLVRARDGHTTRERYPVPVGRVAATVTVTHCLPIYDGRSLNYTVPPRQRHVAIKQRGRVDLSTHDPTAATYGGWNHDDITEQTVWQSGGWLPGRWALQVTDPTPVEAPCMSPQRIQLRRTKGWRKPEGAIVVARPSKWGNPYDWRKLRPAPSWRNLRGIFIHPDRGARHWSISMYRDLINGIWDPSQLLDVPDELVAEFHAASIAWQKRLGQHPTEALADLAGHDLACWCPLEDGSGGRTPCHADVLLELANPEVVFPWSR